jgi:arsenate reductase
MKIYHNPRCSKSREGLAILQTAKVDFEIIDYIKNPLSFEDLQEVLEKLGIPAIALVRKNETVWKEKFKGKTLSEEEVIEAMVAYPKLIERPIVIKENSAVIGRPPEKIKSLF